MLTQLFENHKKLKPFLENSEKYWKQKSVSAKEILLNSGEHSRYIYFIEKGCLRLWNNYNGKDITIDFFFENDFITSFESLLKNVPSDFNIETIEACELLMISKEDWFQIMNENPPIKDMFLEFTSNQFISHMKHFLPYIQDSPEKRYQNLLLNKPYIVQRVPLLYIASYLGITTVSLSRIRARKLELN